MTVIDFKGLNFPAFEAELLRQAKAVGGDCSMLAVVEAAADRGYVSTDNLLAELHLFRG